MGMGAAKPCLEFTACRVRYWQSRRGTTIVVIETSKQGLVVTPILSSLIFRRLNILFTHEVCFGQPINNLPGANVTSTKHDPRKLPAFGPVELGGISLFERLWARPFPIKLSDTPKTAEPCKSSN